MTNISADADPSIRITLMKGAALATFAIDRSTIFAGYWAFLEESDTPRFGLVQDLAAAVALREEFDLHVRRLLEDGWTPAP